MFNLPRRGSHAGRNPGQADVLGFLVFNNPSRTQETEPMAKSRCRRSFRERLVSGDPNERKEMGRPPEFSRSPSPAISLWESGNIAGIQIIREPPAAAGERTNKNASG